MDIQGYLDEFTRRDWQQADAETEPIRLAMVGLGWWVREMAIPAVREATHCETTVLVSRDKDDAEALAAEQEGIEAGLSTEEFHDGRARDAYDAVYICTPNATHLPYVESAAEFEKAVLCEKPMEATVKRAEQMVEVATEGEITLMVAYRMHTEPAVRRMRDLLADGVLGDPVQLHGHMSQPLLEVIPNPDQWRLDPEMAGWGSTVTDIGLYPLNTARYLLEEDPIAVQGTMSSHTDAFADVPDEHAAFTLEFPEGVTAVCTASQHAAQSSHISVVGTEGTARIDPAFFPDEPRTLTVSRNKTTIQTTFDQIDQMREEFDYFADCLLTGRQPDADGEHGLVDMQVMQAIYEAAEEEQRVSI